MPLRQLTVKLATQLHLRSYLDAQLVAHTRFLQEASGLAAGVPVADGVLATLRGNFSRMWQTVRWENAEKETYWRLAVDGIPLGGNSHMRNRPVDACACGLFPSAATSGHSPRQHHFWGCMPGGLCGGQSDLGAGRCPRWALSALAAWPCPLLV